MKHLSLSEIDAVRNLGFRPQAVGCFLHGKKVFMFFDGKYGIWQFPQGGIENGETIPQALKREMAEELGDEFVSKADFDDCSLIGEDFLVFPPKKQGTRNLQNDIGDKIKMKGKYYFFVPVQTTEGSFAEEVSLSQFDDWRLLTYTQANELAETIYQAGKKKLTKKILDALKQEDLLE